jgi:hypothetical protein
MRLLTIAALLLMFAVAVPLFAAPSDVRLASQPGLAETVSQAMTKQAATEPVKPEGILFEGSIIKPILNAKHFGGGLSAGVVVPDNLPFIGSVLGGHLVFADLLLTTDVDERAFLGGSISLHKYDQDDRWRIGGKVLGPGGLSIYARYGVPLSF